MHDKVSRLRQLMADAVPKPAPRLQAEEDAWHHFEYFAANSSEAGPLDGCARARAVREINRIALWYQVNSALVSWLDRADATGIACLADDQVMALRDHMRQLEDCAQSGLGSPYCPPAS